MRDTKSIIRLTGKAQQVFATLNAMQRLGGKLTLADIARLQGALQ